MGAWIETNAQIQAFPTHLSHPMWVRGLKHPLSRIVYQREPVAPYVGAWIETYLCNMKDKSQTSHPMWVRGLKQTDISLD